MTPGLLNVKLAALESSVSEKLQGFDEFSSRYENHIQESINFSGKEQSFFTQLKADEIVRLARENFTNPSEINVLDVGCGTGLTDNFLSKNFSNLSGVDSSQKMLDLASKLNPGVNYKHYDAEKLPYPDGAFDITFAICVMHHVKPEHWTDFLAEMKRVTRPNGIVAIFEHNPWNPLTRRVVNNCEWDDDAVLLSQPTTRILFNKTGMTHPRSRFIVFFPFASSIFRHIERVLRWLPLGGQYYTFCRVSNG